jgi:hypothetical protein
LQSLLRLSRHTHLPNADQAPCIDRSHWWRADSGIPPPRLKATDKPGTDNAETVKDHSKPRRSNPGAVFSFSPGELSNIS